MGPEVLERVLQAVNAIPERVRSIVHEEMGVDRVRNIVNEGLRREIEGLRRMLGVQVRIYPQLSPVKCSLFDLICIPVHLHCDTFIPKGNVGDGNCGDQSQRGESVEQEEEGLGGEEGLGRDQATDDRYDVGDDEDRQYDQDWQDYRGCVYERVNDEPQQYQKLVPGDVIPEVDESNLPLVLCEDSSSLERAGGLEVAAAPSLPSRSPSPVDKLFSHMPFYFWRREAGKLLSVFGIPGLVHPGAPGAEDPDVTQLSLASSSPFSMRETCLLLVAPPNTDSCPVSEEGKIDTDGKEEEIPNTDESLAPLVLWQDTLLHDHPCPVEGRQSGPDDPSEDQTCPMLVGANITESCPVSDDGNLEINGDDEGIPKEDASFLPLVLWVDPSLHDPPCPVVDTDSGPDDPSEDQTCATLMVAQITEGCPVSDVGDSENNGVDEDKREASQASSSAVRSPSPHPLSPSHSDSHLSVPIKSDPDLGVPEGSPPWAMGHPHNRCKHTPRRKRNRLRRVSQIVSPTLPVEEPISELASVSGSRSSGEQSTCTPTNQRKRRLSAIISETLPNWEPPVIDVHTNDTGGSWQQVLDDTALARQRQRELWFRSPYSNPLSRGILSTGPSREIYAQFKIDSTVL